MSFFAQPPPDKPFDMSEPAPSGYRWELCREADWRLVEGHELKRRCNRPGCEHSAAAALKRPMRRRFSNRVFSHRWWLYCADHLYGRVIVDGAVMIRRAVPVGSASIHSPESILSDLRELAARPDDGDPMRFSPRDARVILKMIEEF